MSACLYGAGVSLAAPDVHGAPAAAAPAHTVPSAVPANPAAAAAARPAQANDGAKAPPPSVATALPAGVGASASQGDHIVRPNPDDHPGDRHHGDHHDNRNFIYPYDYWNPNWNGYGDAYNDNEPTYPGQFNQPDAAVAEPNEQPTNAIVPPPQPDTASPALGSALEASPQWRDADAQMKIAQAEYDAASARVLAQLRAQPAYQQALEKKQQEAQKVAALKAKDPDPSIARASPIATAKLDAAKSVTDMENAALVADPQAAAAKAKLDAALAVRDEARQAVEASLSKTPPVAGR